MSYALVFIPDAFIEYQEAFDWYEAQSVGLGEAFEQKVDECFSKMTLNPQIHTSINKKYREALIDIFPFIIIYRIDNKTNVVYIHSVFHTSRRPKKKYRKL